MTAAAALTGLAGVATYVSSRSGASAGADTLRPAAVSLARALPTEASFTFGDSEAVAAGTASTAASTTGSENSCTDTDEVLIYKVRTFSLLSIHLQVTAAPQPYSIPH